MLVLKRHEEEAILVQINGETIARIVVAELTPGNVRLGFDGPRHVKFIREELLATGPWKKELPTCHD